VLRLRAGDSIAVFDGRGREAVARVQAIASKRVSVQIVGPRDAVPEPRVSITLAQALLKSDKMDRVIRDAVMLGVSAVQPFVSRRTEVPFEAAASRGRRDRWERTVLSSVKQCGRAVVPAVHETRRFAAVLSARPGETRLMFVEPGTGADVRSLASLEEEAPPSAAVVFIGPEGGWDPQEIAEAAAAGVRLFSFGRRVLRADAAGAAIVAVLRYIWRDI
jgi:16S rRNA (uracil1498-N3)-methyltransferase